MAEDEPDRIRRGNLVIEWVNLGEGSLGDYDPEDPENLNLLRFDVSVVVPHGTYPEDDILSHRLSLMAGDLEDEIAVEDASYCTLVPSDTDDDTRKNLLLLLMNRISDSVGTEYPWSTGDNLPHIKKLCEELSWIDPSWVEDEENK